MDRRAQAIEILQRAREELSRRLTERILDAEDEILDDARGERYLSEIETLYDELGARLAHVSGMLAHLLPCGDVPLEREDRADEEGQALGLAGEAEWISPDLLAELSYRGRLALPPPSPTPATGVDLATELRAFLRCVQRGDSSAAAGRLAALFGLLAARAQRCADVFAVQAALRGELYTRVMRLKGALEGGALDDLQALLYDCFGLEPAEATLAVEQLLERFGPTAPSRQC
ncbi:MAG TPA: hypothetical protein VG433_14770 [Pirellulales bacterium]|nr:hypothetical protein [Pirellulales bacterium]